MLGNYIANPSAYNWARNDSLSTFSLLFHLQSFFFLIFGPSSDSFLLPHSDLYFTYTLFMINWLNLVLFLQGPWQWWFLFLGVHRPVPFRLATRMHRCLSLASEIPFEHSTLDIFSSLEYIYPCSVCKLFLLLFLSLLLVRLVCVFSVDGAGRYWLFFFPHMLFLVLPVTINSLFQGALFSIFFWFPLKYFLFPVDIVWYC